VTAAMLSTDWHRAAAVLLAVLSLLVAVVIVVEVAVWRRFKELKAMFGAALKHGESFDAAFASLRAKDADSSEQLTELAARVDQIDAEVHRLATYHRQGAAHEGR
jgi:cell division protein FtsB